MAENLTPKFCQEGIAQLLSKNRARTADYNSTDDNRI